MQPFVSFEEVCQATWIHQFVTRWMGRLGSYRMEIDSAKPLKGGEAQKYKSRRTIKGYTIVDKITQGNINIRLRK